jgi:Spy/CpxP family protein refolding chaperone
MATRSFPRVLALGLAATLVCTGAAWAGSADTVSTARHGAHKLQERLGLTDEQVAAIKEINDRRAAERKQLAQSLRQARAELKEAALNGGDVKAKTAAVTALVAQMTEMHASTLQEISPLLTPEQREAMAKMSHERHRHHHHRGPRPTQS